MSAINLNQKTERLIAHVRSILEVWTVNAEACSNGALQFPVNSPERNFWMAKSVQTAEHIKEIRSAFRHARMSLRKKT